MSKFKQLQKQRDISNKQAARMFGVSERTVTRWRKSEAPIAVIKVLETLEAA